MGLKQYLTKRQYVGEEYSFNEVKLDIKLTVYGKEVPIIRPVSEIRSTVMYWHKASQINGWMNDNVGTIENGVDIEVSSAQLTDLMRTCTV